MTISEQREFSKIYTMYEMGMIDAVARSLSALIRATRQRRTALQLLAEAERMGVRNHPDFIV